MKKLILALPFLAAACGSSAPVENHGDKYHKSDVVVSAPGPAECNIITDAEAEVALRLTNQKRASEGLTPLSVNPKLMKIASLQACNQAKSGVMSHAGPDHDGPKHRAKANGYKPRIIAENIASGPFDVEKSAKAWNASKDHTGNIMIPETREFGIGSAVGPNGFIYWAAVYAVSS